MEKTKRKSGIELLRIIIMFQIILLHLYDYGKLAEFANECGGLTNLAFDAIWAMSRMPVNVFILITGYFMVTSEFDLKKVFNKGKKVYLTMIFYSLLITGIFFVINPDLISVPKIFKAFMPFFSKKWYFLSNYLIILALSPFINLILQKLDKKQYRIFCGIVFIVMSVWTTFANMGGFNKVFKITNLVDPYMGKSVGGFLLMYIIGGYLRRFTTGNNKPQLKYLILFFAFCATDFALRIFPQYSSNVYGMYNNPLVIGEAITIFLFFRDMHFYSSVVNIVAGTTLGIYAIHETSFVRNMLWDNSFFNGIFTNSSVLTVGIAAFVYCACIFVVCCLLDLMRQKLFNGIAYLYQKRKNLISKG